MISDPVLFGWLLLRQVARPAGAQEIRQTMQSNSAALQWRHLMVTTLQAAQHQLAVAEGNVRAKVIALFSCSDR